MYNITHLEPVDYLIIGHLSRDLISNRARLGGTAAYAALTANALGLRVGLVTSWGGEIPLDQLRYFPMVNVPTESSTTFENKETPQGRVQILHHIATPIALQAVPEIWRNTPIVHLAPIAQEVEPSIIRFFPDSMIYITPQGWLRGWDEKGHVHSSEWPEASFVLNQAEAAIISVEDVEADEKRIEEMVVACRVFAVTEGKEGALIYWHGDMRRFRPPEVEELDSTGAGDIFAAAFIHRLHKTRDPWEAARFANELAAASVTRFGLDGVPKPDEIKSAQIEVF